MGVVGQSKIDRVRPAAWELLLWRLYDDVEATRLRRGEQAAEELARRALAAIDDTSGDLASRPTQQKIPVG
jgi:hypothetical protein